MGAPDLTVGDRVQDVCWDGQYTGRVTQVFDDGSNEVEVHWDGTCVFDRISANAVTKLETTHA